MTTRSARRRAAAIAGHTGDELRARELLLDDDDAGVRATALGALARSGHLRAADIAAAVMDTSPVVRTRAAEVCAAAPPETRVPILSLLDDEDVSVIETAAWACGEIDPPEPGAVVALARLVTSHGDALVREAAVAALGAVGDPAGLPAILAATRDRATVRRRAVLALAPFDGPDVDEALARARDDRDWQVRQAADDLTA